MWLWRLWEGFLLLKKKWLFAEAEMVVGGRENNIVYFADPPSVLLPTYKVR